MLLFLFSDLLPEVEIVSLVGEELPQYRLKFDYLTEFAGYDHADFARGAAASAAAQSGETSIFQPLKMIPSALEIQFTCKILTTFSTKFSLTKFPLESFRALQLQNSRNKVQCCKNTRSWFLIPI